MKKKTICVAIALAMFLALFPQLDTETTHAAQSESTTNIDLSRAKNVNGLVNNKSKLFDVYMLAENIGDYDSVRAFSNGRAVVNGDKTYKKNGLIDYYGNVIIPPVDGQYISTFHNGFARILQGNWRGGTSYKYIDVNGNDVFGKDFPLSGLSTGQYGNYGDMEGNFNDGLAPVSTWSGWEYIDTNGETAFKMPGYEVCYEFSDGLALVIKDGRAGYINTTGDLVIDLKFDGSVDSWYQCHSFSEGLALVYTLDGKRGFINKQGNFLFEIPHDKNNIGASFSEGLCYIEDSIYEDDGSYYNKAYYIDKSGKTVIDLSSIKDSCFPLANERFSEGLVAIRFYENSTIGYMYACINTSGKIVFQMDLGGPGCKISSFKNGVALVQTFVMDPARGGMGYPSLAKYGYIDKNGDTIVDFVYDAATEVNDNIAVVKKDGKWSILYFAPKNSTPAPQTPKLTATPTASTVLVNGRKIAFDAYTINGNNYFKLRDLAYVLSSTEKQFEVSFDASSNSINLISGKPYTAVGGELASKGTGNKTPVATTSKILIDGKAVTLTAYTIDNNNYFKLRDIGQAFDFDVTWDGAKNTIIINTSESYTAD